MRASWIVVCTAIALSSGCGSADSKTYSLYGTALITTDPRWEQEVGIAVVETHRAMANYVVNDDGTKSDPTYKARSKNWKSDGGTAACSVSRLEFAGEDGNVNTLQTTCIPSERLLLISCESGDDDATIRLRNELVGVLNSRGFLCAD